MDKKFDKFTRSHQKFRNEINIPVAVASVFSEFLFCGVSFLEFLKQISKIQRCGLSTVEVVPVDMENLQLSTTRTLRIFETLSAAICSMILVMMLYSTSVFVICLNYALCDSTRACWFDVPSSCSRHIDHLGYIRWCRFRK